MRKALILICILLCLNGCSSELNISNTKHEDSINTRKTDYIDESGNIYVYIYGEGEKVYTPDSSFVDYLVYYESSKHMIASLNGKEYIHSNVPNSIWHEFINADSIGSYYNEVFKENPDYWVIGYNGDNGSKINIIYED